MDIRNNNNEIASENSLEDTFFFNALEPILVPKYNRLNTYPGMMVPINEQRDSQKVMYVEPYNPELNPVTYKELFS